MNPAAFSSLPLPAAMLDNIDSLGYRTMTPIQAEALPYLLAGRDLLAQACTGSGKTAAFAIGLLQSVDTGQRATQALILCPTRELAEQVSQAVRRLARHLANTRIVTLCGGKPIAPQRDALQHRPHIVVGTPGRVRQLLIDGSLSLAALRVLVLDEADRMLDMGFQADMLDIIENSPARRQTLLFSATYPEDIQGISAAIQQDPVVVQVENIRADRDIEQIFYPVDKGGRTKRLVALLQHYRPVSSVVFCNRKQQCQELADALWQAGFHARALHGDLQQQERDQVLAQFANGSSSILVATDVAARGLDIPDVQAVINFELPPGPEVYVHRIGRTGRAGRKGLALSLFMENEQYRLDAIESLQGRAVRTADPGKLKRRDNFRLSPPMVTLCIQGGRRHKIRAGDILGALTASADLSGSQVGRIQILDSLSYVAVERPVAKQALRILGEGRIKGRRFRVKKLG